MEKKIWVNADNKLVVQIDNATIAPTGDVAYEIKGDFMVEAEDVAKLCAIINNKNVAIFKCTICDESVLNTYINCRIISKESALKKIEETQESLIEKSLQISETIEQKSMERVKQLIDKYNQSRHWWERKIEIEQ